MALEGTKWGLLLDVMQNEKDKYPSLSRYSYAAVADSRAQGIGGDYGAWLQHPEKWMYPVPEDCKGWIEGTHKKKPKLREMRGRLPEQIRKVYLQCEHHRSKVQTNVWNAMSVTLAEKTQQSTKKTPIILGISSPMLDEGIALTKELPAIIDQARDEVVAVDMYGEKECLNQENKPGFKAEKDCKTKEIWRLG